MIAFSDSPSAYAGRPFATPETVVCPKCQGQGRLRLLRRNASTGAFEVCPACEGRGIAPRKNGAADLMPAHIGKRS